jgi:hypothetical protein
VAKDTHNPGPDDAEIVPFSVGLANPCGTCFMAASVQALLCAVPIVNAVTAGAECHGLSQYDAVVLPIIELMSRMRDAAAKGAVSLGLQSGWWETILEQVHSPH